MGRNKETKYYIKVSLENVPHLGEGVRYQLLDWSGDCGGRTMSIMFGLTAKNSSGTQKLYFTKNECDGVSLTLTGVYNGQDIQIDFDDLDRDEINDIIYLLKR